MVAGFVLRLDGKEGSGDAGSLHRAVVLLSCRNIAIKKQGLGERERESTYMVANNQIRCKLAS
jgi:hypothetical protein